MIKADFIARSVAVLFLCADFFLSACSQHEPPQPTDSSVASLANYALYSNDGVVLRHPPHWSLEYDDSPDLFADKGISFKTSAISYADVLIFNDRDIHIADLVDHVEKSLQLTSANHIDDYQRRPLQLGSYKGIALSWRNTMLAEYKVELSIFQIKTESKRAFVIFNFDESAIRSDAAHRIPFIESIEIK
mgnify:CR=1 FL=1|jgi:hypothetical protein